MKKILMLLILIVLVVILYFFIKNSNAESYFKPVKLSDSNEIVNTTTSSYMDTVVSVGLDVLNVRNCEIVIKSMTDEMKGNFLSQNGLSLEASIMGSNGLYDVYVNGISKQTAITVLSHELVHLKQYETGDLQLIGDGKVTWKGETINVLDLNYEDRPWEREAFQTQTDVANKIKKILY